jgi:hypothetical protein
MIPEFASCRPVLSPTENRQISAIKCGAANLQRNQLLKELAERDRFELPVGTISQVARLKLLPPTAVSSCLAT